MQQWLNVPLLPRTFISKKFLIMSRYQPYPVPGNAQWHQPSHAWTWPPQAPPAHQPQWHHAQPAQPGQWTEGSAFALPAPPAATTASNTERPSEQPPCVSTVGSRPVSPSAPPGSWPGKSVPALNHSVQPSVKPAPSSHVIQPIATQSFPEWWKQSEDCLDTQVDGPHRLTFRRFVASTPWSRKCGLAGMDVTKLDLGSIGYRGWQDIALRGLSHGLWTSLVYMKEPAEGVFCQRLLSAFRTRGWKIDDMASAVSA